METVTLIIALVSGLGGLGGISAAIISLLNYFDSRKGKTLDAKLKPITDDVHALTGRANTGDLNDSRIQLLILINHYPSEHQAILAEAENYFIRLKGDSWMADIVTAWAAAEEVDIDYIRRAHERNVLEKARQLSEG